MSLDNRLVRLEQRTAAAVPDFVIVLAGETEQEARERFRYEQGRPPAPDARVLRVVIVDSRVRPDPGDEAS